MDPLLSHIEFGFRKACETGFDCQAEDFEPAPDYPQAPIDYTARDYAGFRRLMTDRMAQLMPGWRDTGAASPEIALVEMLAHVADRLSYAQDSVATEAYLDTARLRVSARRHARLIGYRMHDGCNARGFVHVTLREPAEEGDPPLAATIARHARFATRIEGVTPASGTTPALDTGISRGAQVFEAMEDAQLSSAHNRIEIHDFGGVVSELAKGATSLQVRDPGRLLDLSTGDLVLIEQVAEPETGDAAPDFDRRYVVRLTGVVERVDPVGATDEGGDPVPLETLELQWHPLDALPESLPFARVETNDIIDGIEPGPDQPSVVVRGNIVAVDHGMAGEVVEVVAERKPGRRRMTLPVPVGPITRAVASTGGMAASSMMASDPAAAQAQMTVQALDDGGPSEVWELADSFLESEKDDAYFVLETREDGTSQLRSGDGIAGRIPEDGTVFELRCRIGSGPAGEVAPHAIAHLLTDRHTGLDGATVEPLGGVAADIVAIRNPKPLGGAVAPETIAEVRRNAPLALRDQARAVTPADYARKLEERSEVQSARAVVRWQGSWRVIVLLVDLVQGLELDDALELEFRKFLEPFRLAGHALEFRLPQFVPLEIDMRVCVLAGVPRRDVEQRLRRLFGSGTSASGSKALFHRDGLTFGDSLRLTPLIAAAQATTGVNHVELTGVRRQGRPGANTVLDDGIMHFGAYEIPVLDNDPNYPDRGMLRLTMEGGV